MKRKTILLIAVSGTLIVGCLGERQAGVLRGDGEGGLTQMSLDNSTQ